VLLGLAFTVMLLTLNLHQSFLSIHGVERIMEAKEVVLAYWQAMKSSDFAKASEYTQ